MRQKKSGTSLTGTTSGRAMRRKLLEKVGLQREAHFRQNIWFNQDENGAPVWKDTYVYAKLNGVSIP